MSKSGQDHQGLHLRVDHHYHKVKNQIIQELQGEVDLGRVSRVFLTNNLPR